MFSSRTRWTLSKNRFTEAVERRRASGHKLIDLTVSNPTECGFEYDERQILAALSQPQGMGYKPEPLGLYAARKAVSSYYAALPQRIVLSPEQMVLTTGTSEAYSFLFRLLCDPGDEVLIAQPGYPLFEFLADLNDVHLAPYPLFYDHGWHIDIHSLKGAVSAKTRAVLVVHPNNPTGSFVSATEREELSKLCHERDLALIADEVFLDYSFGSPVKSFAGNQDCTTFTLSGLSKICGLPQMKVAWAIASGPAQLVQTSLSRLELIADTYLSLSTPLQLATPQLLGARTCFQERLMARVRANLAKLDQQLLKQTSCARLELQGGWYATLRVPAAGSDEELAVQLIEDTGVVVHPGHFFDFTTDGYFVLGLMTPPEEFSEGVECLLGFIAAR